jgi:RNA polymerase sigma factor (sigma-70 family)
MNVTGTEGERLAEQFEPHRDHLKAVAYRMLGSLDEADDAVQEAWLRFSRANSDNLDNLRGWLTVVVARICLDMLRSRKARREDPLEDEVTEPFPSTAPEAEALLADSVGVALLVILNTLAPVERTAFVLHDIFDVPFDEIALIVSRSTIAARQLASRARRRVQGAGITRGSEFARQREVVEAFLAASRAGDFEALLAVLDPDVIMRADRAAVPEGRPRKIHGARTVVERALLVSTQRAPFAQAVLVNGAAGVVVAPRGHLLSVMTFKVAGKKIVEINIVADPVSIHQLALSLLDDPHMP